MKISFRREPLPRDHWPKQSTDEVEAYYAAHPQLTRGQKRTPRKPRDHRWMVAAGLGMILAWIVAPSVPGIILVGSLRQANSLCTSGAGALVQAMNGDAASGCARAANWMTFFNVVGFAGLALTVAGVVLILVNRAKS
jgi:hypothetical protein